ANADRLARAATLGKAWQGFERGARAAVAIDQRAECDWPDVAASDQPQPIEPLAVGQLHIGLQLPGRHPLALRDASRMARHAVPLQPSIGPESELGCVSK